MKKTFSLLFPLFYFASFAIAQEKEGVSTGDIVLYRNEIHGGPLIHTNGWGATFRKGIHVTGTRKRFLEFDYVNMKHPKEIRSVNPYYKDARGYIYGKQNAFSILRSGVGFQNTLNGKDQRKGVEVRYHYFIGPSVGFIKPIYLEIIRNNIPISTEKYDPQKHHIDNIYGKAPFSRGIDELKLQPGLYGKFGLSFEYSAYDDYVRAIETGFTIDAYSKRVPIMALTENNQFFFNFYISIVYGKKEF